MSGGEYDGIESVYARDDDERLTGDRPTVLYSAVRKLVQRKKLFIMI